MNGVKTDTAQSEADNYGGFELRKGDNDKSKKWGGSARPLASGEHVKALQENLKQLKVYMAKIDGDFGGKTELAVKMFKWNAKNVGHRLKDCMIVPDVSKLKTGNNGTVDCPTVEEIKRWKKNQFEATGDLVRVHTDQFNAIVTEHSGELLKKLNHPDVGKNEFVVSEVLLEYLKKADTKAHELCLTIKINDALRVVGIPVSGAVVKPAKRSQHFIGHAIDCNLIDDGNWNSSSTFKQGKETENAKSFINAMKENGMRWGGDFAAKTSSKFDPIHFDKRLDPYSDDYEYKHFFNQRVISEKTRVPLKNG